MSSPRLLLGRVSQRGASYVITAIVHGRRAVLRERVADDIADEIRKLEADRCIANVAWVLMPDHVHWLFQLEEGRLAAVVQAFKSRSARAANQRLGISGAFWQAGYYDHQLRHGEDLHAQARYILANPLRCGLVTRIEDYPHWWCRWVASSTDL